MVEGEEIREYHDIDVGVAVPLEDGLIVPVVRHVDRLDLAEIVAHTDEAIARVRSGRTDVQLVTGGTFTVTNLGPFGIDAFTPIVNRLRCAILGVGRITERPVRDHDSIAWTRRMTLSLTFDHRAVDGVPAAMFLRTLTEQLEDPGALFA